MNKISATDARKRLKESRTHRSEERKKADMRRKSVLESKRNQQKCLSEFFDRALSVALEGQNEITITEVEYDLIADQLECLGFDIEESSTRVKADLKDLTSSELLKLAKKLHETLSGIRKYAIQYGKSKYCDLIDDYEKTDLALSGLKSTVALRIETLGIIRDWYNSDLNVTVGTHLADIADVLDRYYSGELADEESGLTYSVTWCADSYDSVQEPSMWTANKLYFVSSSSDTLFECLENSVDQAVADNKSYFYFGASGNDESEYVFSDQTSIAAPLSPENFANVLAKQGFRCEVLSSLSKQGGKRLKVSF